MKPARVFYNVGVVWCPLVSFSSDALGMPWEYVGDNSFLWKNGTTRCFKRTC
jgi:hypothetical protein